MNRPAGLLACTLLFSAAPAAADDASSDQEAWTAKKDRYLAEKRSDANSAEDRARWQETLEARIGKPPPEVINVYNTWTHEYLAVEADVEPDVPKERIDRFLRCHFTNEPADMDEELFATLIRAANHFDAERIDVISGFRAPKYNLILRKKGREVARNSQHTRGTAVDFRVRGVSVHRLHRWVRAQRLGGVGFYPTSGFVHMDTARVRYWSGR